MKKIKWSREKLQSYILGTSPKQFDPDLVRRVIESMEEPLGYIEFKQEQKKKKVTI